MDEIPRLKATRPSCSTSRIIQQAPGPCAPHAGSRSLKTARARSSSPASPTSPSPRSSRRSSFRSFDASSADPARSRDHILLTHIDSPRAARVDDIRAAAQKLEIPAVTAPDACSLAPCATAEFAVTRSQRPHRRHRLALPHRRASLAAPPTHRSPRAPRPPSAPELSSTPPNPRLRGT